VNTVNAQVDLDACLALLRVDGTMVSVGAPAEPLSLAVVNLLAGRWSVASSATGGMALSVRHRH
jgi:uncharacterized zinc-type alcohol dehydrogenase-like protein